MLPLSRVLQPSDWPTFPEAIRSVVTDRFRTAVEQHPARKIEYATVLQALQEMSLERTLTRIVDVGGHGSPLPSMIEFQCGVRPEVVDPEAPGGKELHQYLQGLPRLADVVLAVSVLEHVEDEAGFLYELASLVVPGGWLMLTVDYADTTPDTYHFHWMRERIYSSVALERVATLLTPLRLRFWPDEARHTKEHLREAYGARFESLLFDYSFASLVMRKSLRP